eukprot:1159156-Pelagomonas_calceolata.AAC.1
MDKKTCNNVYAVHPCLQLLGHLKQIRERPCLRYQPSSSAANAGCVQRPDAQAPTAEPQGQLHQPWAEGVFR